MSSVNKEYWTTQAKQNDANRESQLYSFLQDRKDAKKRSRDDENYDATTLHISHTALNNMSGMERQFWEIKKNYFDVIIFFKKGKFYELYDVDAEVGSKEFGLKCVGDTTNRGKMRMAGVPEQSFSHWAQQFILRGYRVGRVEQMAPAKTEGGSGTTCVPRELVRVYSAGTLCDAELIDTADALYVLSVREEEGNNIAVFTIDCSRLKGYHAMFTGTERHTHFGTFLRHVSPKEVILASQCSTTLARIIAATSMSAFVLRVPPEQSHPTFDPETVIARLRQQYPDPTHSPMPDCVGSLMAYPSPVIGAFGGILYYLHRLKIQPDVLTPHTEFSAYNLDEAVSCHVEHMALDVNTLEHLEVLKSDTGMRSVLSRVDHTVTPSGKRLLRKWVLEPLRDREAIQARQEAITLLMGHRKKDTYALFKTTVDVERQSIRLKCVVEEKVVSWVDTAAYGKKIMSLLMSTITTVQKMIKALHACLGDVTKDESSLLHNLFVDSFPKDLARHLEDFLKLFDAPQAVESGFPIPHPGTNPEHDKWIGVLNTLRAQLHQILIEARGYFNNEAVDFIDAGKELFLLEVPLPCKEAPKGWIEHGRTQKVVKFRSPQTEPLAKKFKAASDERHRVLQLYLKDILRTFSEMHLDILRVNLVAATVDALHSLAFVSSQPGMCRPTLLKQTTAYFSAQGLYHPCTVLAPGCSVIVPNDIVLDPKQGRVVVLTGPNMGGKSTLMRAVAVAVILAQMGCYVNARHCEMSPVDRIYTRIGAKDNLFQQQSTFFVEVGEMSHILRYATPRSLVIVDELGRGTSTFDGYAVAYGTLRFLAQTSCCLVLFSTHYYFLAVEASSAFADQNVRAMHMRYGEDPTTKEVILLHQLTPGICSNSYGVEVARRAGVLDCVLACAQRKSKEFARQLGVDDSSSRRMMVNTLRGILLQE